MADNHCSPYLQSIHYCLYSICIKVKSVVCMWFVTLSEAGKINEDHPCFVAEIAELFTPRIDVTTEAVNKYYVVVTAAVCLIADFNGIHYNRLILNFLQSMWRTA